MKELIVINFESSSYGVWKDDVLDIRDIRSVHKLPLLPEHFAGVSENDGRMASLFDLGVCMGHKPIDRKRPGQALIMSEGKELEGFVFGGKATHIEVSPDDVLPMPECLKASELDKCVYTAGRAVPIINIETLYKNARARDWRRPALQFQGEAPHQDLSSADAFRNFKLKGDTYVVPANTVETEAVRQIDINLNPLPLAASHVEGIIFKEGRPYAVLNLARYMGLDAGSRDGTVFLARSKGLGFIVDNDMGVLQGKTAPKPLPPIACSDLMDFGLLENGEVMPVVNIHSALSALKERDHLNDYTTDSDFPAVFGKGEAEIVELVIAGMRHGLPYSEVEDVIDSRPYRKVVNLSPIIVGVTEYEGEILPVLDLAVCFGKRTVRAGQKMLVLKNGNFSALLVTVNPPKKRLLQLEEQRELPITLPKQYVYGCYLDEKTVSLVLNVEALATNFVKNELDDYFYKLYEEMAMEPEVSEPPKWISIGPSAEEEEPEIEGVEEIVEPVAAMEPMRKTGTDSFKADDVHPDDHSGGIEEGPFPKEPEESKKVKEGEHEDSWEKEETEREGELHLAEDLAPGEESEVPSNGEGAGSTELSLKDAEAEEAMEAEGSDLADVTDEETPAQEDMEPEGPLAFTDEVDEIESAGAEGDALPEESEAPSHEEGAGSTELSLKDAEAEGAEGVEGAEVTDEETPAQEAMEADGPLALPDEDGEGESAGAEGDALPREAEAPSHGEGAGSTELSLKDAEAEEAMEAEGSDLADVTDEETPAQEDMEPEGPLDISNKDDEGESAGAEEDALPEESEAPSHGEGVDSTELSLKDAEAEGAEGVEGAEVKDEETPAQEAMEADGPLALPDEVDEIESAGAEGDALPEESEVPSHGEGADSTELSLKDTEAEEAKEAEGSDLADVTDEETPAQEAMEPERPLALPDEDGEGESAGAEGDALPEESEVPSNGEGADSTELSLKDAEAEKPKDSTADTDDNSIKSTVTPESGEAIEHVDSPREDEEKDRVEVKETGNEYRPYFGAGSREAASAEEPGISEEPFEMLDETRKTAIESARRYADAASGRQNRRRGVYAALILLLLAVIALSWNFLVTDEKPFDEVATQADRATGKKDTLITVAKTEPPARKNPTTYAKPEEGKGPSKALVTEPAVNKKEQTFALPKVEPAVKKEEQASMLPEAEPAVKKEEKASMLLEIEPEKEKVSMRLVKTKPADAKVYIVKKGDTLWNIAKRFTGNPFNYPRIAADSEIKNPDLIFPKQKIFIKIKKS